MQQANATHMVALLAEHQTYRLRVRVLPRHHCAVALGKLLRPVCLWNQAV